KNGTISRRRSEAQQLRINQRLGAEGGTRTPTGCPIRPSNVRVYQFHHFGTLGRLCGFQIKPDDTRRHNFITAKASCRAPVSALARRLQQEQSDYCCPALRVGPERLPGHWSSGRATLPEAASGRSSREA